LEIICGNVKCTAKVSSNLEETDSSFIVRSALIDITKEKELSLKQIEMIRQMEFERDEKEKIEKENERLIDFIKQNEKLESLGVLAGGIAHDFNNLLSGVFGFIEMALEKADESETVTKYLKNAVKSFENAKSLSSQLLTFSKGGEPVMQICDLGKIIKESTDFALAGSNVKCEINIDRKLECIKADSNQISQVLNNIIINAKQAMPAGGGIKLVAENVYVEKELFPFLNEGSFVIITIADNGVGIPKENLKKIFDPFFSTKKEGHGLGLATSYSIIKKHSGHIEVESLEGEGTKFTIFIPSSGEKVCKEIEPESILQKEIEGKVVVMDDQEAVRMMIKEMLNIAGVEVVLCSDGLEAVKTIEKMIKEGEKIAAAIFDLTVPGGVGGVEAVKMIVEKKMPVKVIASSGYSDDPVMSRPVEFGFHASIAKPYKLNDLINVMKRMTLENRSTTK